MNIPCPNSCGFMMEVLFSFSRKNKMVFLVKCSACNEHYEVEYLKYRKVKTYGDSRDGAKWRKLVEEAKERIRMSKIKAHLTPIKKKRK